MISYQDAQNILHGKNSLAAVIMPSTEAAGFISLKNVVSHVNVPSFLNSAMDGFAVNAADLALVAPGYPILLKVKGSSKAGQPVSTGKGGAWEIMTGASVPCGYDTVVRIEDVKITKTNESNEPEEILISSQVTKGENIREPGQDFKPDSLIISKGNMVTPATIMSLAAIGKQNIMVAKKPEVTVFSSGCELVENKTKNLNSGQIRDTNGPYLLSALNICGCSPTFGGVIRDDPQEFERLVKHHIDQTHIFISTGAVSAGKYDFIPSSLENIGAEILFHKVGIRPGKPILYARLPNGSHYFGLPGNPISAAIGFRFFVVPLVRHIQTMPIEKPLKARLKKSAKKVPSLRFFAKARVNISEHAELEVDILEGQESFKTHPLLQANCWAIFPENEDNSTEGDLIDVYPLMPGAWNFDRLQ